MSSSRSSSPSTIPFKFRRKSSSASTSVSLDDPTREDAALSSPLPSSSPPMTPPYDARQYEYPQWDHPEYVDDVGGASYDQADSFGDAMLPWSCYRQDQKTSSVDHPLPSLMTKFAAQALKNQSSSPFQSPLYATCRTTSYFYPHGESALADDCEEYDLESVDFHVRETYFATSSERGRWLSSPIATRVRTETISPRHGQSSPVKTTVGVSPSACVPRRITNSLADKVPSSPSLSEDHAEDVHFSSSLPPSSPSTSPISNLSFLPDDCEDDKIAEYCSPISNPNSYSPLGASDLSISPNAHTLPIGSQSPLSRPPDTVPGPKPSNSIHVSRSSSPCPGHVSTDAQVVPACSPDATSSKLDIPLSSPLSLFDDLFPEEPPIPHPNANTPHCNQLPNTPDRMANGAFGTSSSSIHGPPADSLLFDAKHETPNPLGEPSTIGTKKRKDPSHSDVPQKKKRAVVQLPASLTNLKEKVQERRTKGRHVSGASEPRKNKSKSSDRSSHLEISRTKPSRRHSHSAIEADCVTVAPQMTLEPAYASLCQEDPADAEFRASLTGMLIEALATSRATSMDCSALYLAITQTHPHLLKERPKQEFQVLIAGVLESGRARCGMFEKVDSSGEASRHKALENRWFYVPDRDEDRERASLISAIMPRQKRTETKKYKQYYFRPLEKISRWDPEDAP